MALINSELYEALEAHRKGHRVDIASTAFGIVEGSKVPEAMDTDIWRQNFEFSIKDTYEDELADAVIRILDYTGGFGIKLTTDLSDMRLMLPENFGEAILQINNNINYAFYQKEDSRWSYILADIVDLAQYGKFDILFHTNAKLRYNRTRAHKHGKSY